VSHLHHKVSALIDGELSANARTRALAHARTCAQCRREIAETLDIPIGTAHSRLHHAMRGLRAALDAETRPPVREAVL